MAQSALATRPATVLVKNVYHLMSYAFDAVDVKEYRTLETEDFSGMDDLLAAILLLGIESQRRRGLERDYQPVEEQGCLITSDLRKWSFDFLENGHEKLALRNF